MDIPLITSTACLGDQETQAPGASTDLIREEEHGVKELPTVSDTVEQNNAPTEMNNQNLEPIKMEQDPIQLNVKLKKSATAAMQEDEDYPVLDLEMEEDDDDDASFDYNESNNTNASLHEKIDPAGPSDTLSSATDCNDNNQNASSERTQRSAAIKAKTQLANVVAALQPTRHRRGAQRDNSNSNNTRRRRKSSLQVRTRSQMRNTNNRRKRKQSASGSRSRSRVRI